MDDALSHLPDDPAALKRIIATVSTSVSRYRIALPTRTYGSGYRRVDRHVASVSGLTDKYVAVSASVKRRGNEALAITIDLR